MEILLEGITSILEDLGQLGSTEFLTLMCSDDNPSSIMMTPDPMTGLLSILFPPMGTEEP
jgi:hypothetical protein